MEKEKIKYTLMNGVVTEVSILASEKQWTVCEFYNMYGRHKIIRATADIFNSKTAARKSLKTSKK